MEDKVVRVKDRDKRILNRLVLLVDEAMKTATAEESILNDTILSIRDAMGLDERYRLDAERMVFVLLEKPTVVESKSA